MGAPENPITKEEASNFLGHKEHVCGNCGEWVFAVRLKGEEHHDYPDYEIEFVCMNCGGMHTHKINT